MMAIKMVIGTSTTSTPFDTIAGNALSFAPLHYQWDIRIV